MMLLAIIFLNLQKYIFFNLMALVINLIDAYLIIFETLGINVNFLKLFNRYYYEENN